MEHLFLEEFKKDVEKLMEVQAKILVLISKLLVEITLLKP